MDGDVFEKHDPTLSAFPAGLEFYLYVCLQLFTYVFGKCGGKKCTKSLWEIFVFYIFSGTFCMFYNPYLLLLESEAKISPSPPARPMKTARLSHFPDPPVMSRNY